MGKVVLCVVTGSSQIISVHADIKSTRKNNIGLFQGPLFLSTSVKVKVSSRVSKKIYRRWYIFKYTMKYFYRI
jgi:hypothetical protein